MGYSLWGHKELETIERIFGNHRLLLHWIPGYGELARPLYKLITETQQAQTNKLVWSPDIQKAFKALQTALLQAPTLSLSKCQNLICFSLKEKVWPWEF